LSRLVLLPFVQVLLDTGEWCSASISGPKNKALKYEVMFGGDESDKARLPVPTDRACLAAGTLVEVHPTRPHLANTYTPIDT
jgi:hypothetical protein